MRKGFSVARIDGRRSVAFLLLLAVIANIWSALTSNLSRTTGREDEPLAYSSKLDTFLLSPSLMEQTGSGFGRAFPIHLQHNRTWCTKQSSKAKRDKTKQNFWLKPPKGLFYVKVPKSASSTVAGVMHRISRRHGGCDFHAHHTGGPGAGHWYGNRDKSASFLIGSIRNPATRAISRIFFYQVSRLQETPTDANLIKWLTTTNSQFGAISDGQGGFQLRYMSLDNIEAGSAWNEESPSTVLNATQVHEHVNKIVHDYDFLIVVERMDESLVVLTILLGIDIGDTLTLSSKVQGSYQYGKQKGCFPNVKAELSPFVNEYLSSDLWYAQNYGDYVLHAAANASLDKTIDALGRSRVEEAVAEYRRLKKMVDEQCASRAYFPCSKDGVDQLEKSKESCYEKDFGCGHDCIDEMLQSESRHTNGEITLKFRDDESVSQTGAL